MDGSALAGLNQRRSRAATILLFGGARPRRVGAWGKHGQRTYAGAPSPTPPPPTFVRVSAAITPRLYMYSCELVRWNAPLVARFLGAAAPIGSRRNTIAL